MKRVSYCIRYRTKFGRGVVPDMELKDAKKHLTYLRNYSQYYKSITVEKHTTVTTKEIVEI